MYQALLDKKKKIAILGLGYVGLPLALEFGKHFSVIGYDINAERVELMKRGVDPSRELSKEAFDNIDIDFTTDLEVLRTAHCFIVAVPTDIDKHRVPDLTPLKSVSKTIGKVLKKGDYVIYEPTVYPGCTEEDCLTILEKVSNLKVKTDFKLGYSPERIVPGSKDRTLATITKIVSACDEESLEEMAKIYGQIIQKGIYKTSSIKVAEAAKVIENIQRDINISLVNELAIIFDRMGIDTKEVIEAAGTKWNFIKFYPGLVGGHCIGIDPYYLLHKSKQLGYDPQVIASGRRINDYMSVFIAKKLVQKLIENAKSPRDCNVLVMGVTFKENVSDIRNSKVVDLVKELMEYSLNVDITDVQASPKEIEQAYQLSLTTDIKKDYDAVIVAVAHAEYKALDTNYFKSIMQEEPILFDLKGIYQKEAEGMDIWRL